MIEAVLAALLCLAAGSAVFTFWFSRFIESRYPPIGRRLAVGRSALHVVETSPQGTERGNVLLVHGGSGNFADPHTALADRLAALGFRVYAVDRPGHGYSDRLEGQDAASPRRQAALIRDALQGCGVDQAIVVVHSLAGALGLAMALDAPAFTRGLVLLAPVSHPWKGGVTWYYGVAAAPILGALFRWLIVPIAGLATMRGALVEVFAPNPVPDDYINRTGLQLLLRPRQFLANAQDFVALHASVTTLSPRYREIEAPTEIVMGAQDGLVSVDIHARQCARDIPGARLRLLEGVGHSPHFSATEAAVEAIVEVARRAAKTKSAPARETA